MAEKNISTDPILLGNGQGVMNAGPEEDGLHTGSERSETVGDESHLSDRRHHQASTTPPPERCGRMKVNRPKK